MYIWKSLAGMYHIRITGASIPDTLTCINAAGILLHNVFRVDELTVVGTIYRGDYKRLLQLLDRRGEFVKIQKKEGIFWTLLSLKKRPVLLIGLAVLLVLILYLPTRVLFIEVEGNDIVPAQLILERAESCGITFGASRRHVRSEKMKNALLAAVPELQWAGVNTSGCVAIISVRERSAAPQNENHSGVASIVAKEDGIISDITVKKGNPLCRVGQAVKAGQVLVSGYTDCGLTIKAERADAEVYAQTKHQLEVITASKCVRRDASQRFEKKYYLQIGKKLIKFANDSGISSATCVKMYERKYLTLPGGFRLPVAWITEQLIYQPVHEYELTSNSFSWLTDYASRYLQSQMVAGKILDTSYTWEQSKDTFSCVGDFACMEMIGQIRSEEIIQGDGKRS